MEEAVSQVILKLDQTEKCIEDIDTKLDKKFSHLLDGKKGIDRDLAIREFNEIKQEFASVQKEALELGHLQREMIVTFQQGISETVSTLQRLADSSAASSKAADHSPDAKDLVESLVNQSEMAQRLTDKLKGST